MDKRQGRASRRRYRRRQILIEGFGCIPEVRILMCRWREVDTAIARQSQYLGSIVRGDVQLGCWLLKPLAHNSVRDSKSPSEFSGATEDCLQLLDDLCQRVICHIHPPLPGRTQHPPSLGLFARPVKPNSEHARIRKSSEISVPFEFRLWSARKPSRRGFSGKEPDESDAERGHSGWFWWRAEKQAGLALPG